MLAAPNRSALLRVLQLIRSPAFPLLSGIPAAVFVLVVMAVRPRMARSKLLGYFNSLAEAREIRLISRDFVFPSVRLKGKKQLSASIMVQKYLRPAAVKAGVIKEGEKVRFGFHNFRHALATALVKLRVDAKTVQGMLRHEDFGTTMQLYAQSDMESMREAQGKFLEQLLGDRMHLLTERVQ